MPPPVISHCILCEDVRLERRNLSSFMGVYGATPDVGIVVKDTSLKVGFVLVFMGPPVDGKFNITAELHSPVGRIETRVRPPVFEADYSRELGGIIFAFRFATIFRFGGTYSIVLFDNGRIFFETLSVLFRGASRVTSGAAVSAAPT